LAFILRYWYGAGEVVNEWPIEMVAPTALERWWHKLSFLKLKGSERRVICSTATRMLRRSCTTHPAQQASPPAFGASPGFARSLRDAGEQPYRVVASNWGTNAGDTGVSRKQQTDISLAGELIAS
jgi:hypothetical protein